MKNLIALLIYLTTTSAGLIGQSLPSPIASLEPAVGQETARLNGNPTFSFASTQQHYPILDIPATDGFLSVYTIYRTYYPGSEQIVWSLAYADRAPELLTTQNAIDLSTGALLHYKLQDIRRPHLQRYDRRKSIIAASKLYLAHAPSSTGKLPAVPLIGQVGEVRVYDGSLDDRAQRIISTYFSLKYGLPLARSDQSDYLSGNGSVLWSAGPRSTYRHRVTGAGLDSITGLQQLQSSSSYAPDLLTLGIGTIAKDNVDHPGQLAEQSYILWADNDEKMRFSALSEHPLFVLARRWRIEANWSLESSFMSLSFNSRRWDHRPSLEKRYWLVVDRSGTGKFDRQNCDLYPGKTMEAERIQFDEVRVREENKVCHFTLLIGAKDVIPNWTDTLAIAGNAVALGKSPEIKINQRYISPNPTTDGKVNLAIRLNQTGPVTIRLINAIGRQLEERSFAIASYHESDFFLPNRGVFFLQITTPDDQVTAKVIRQ